MHCVERERAAQNRMVEKWMDIKIKNGEKRKKTITIIDENGKLSRLRNVPVWWDAKHKDWRMRFDDLVKLEFLQHPKSGIIVTWSKKK
jgi:hypothetical protein